MIHIDVQCKSCKARYRVKEEFAGRMVRCKHCGDKFRVPYRSIVSTLTDDVAVEAAPPTNPPVPLEREADDSPPEPVEIAASKRTFNEYAGIKKSETRRRRENAREIAGEPYLPPLIAELWLPLAITLLGYGIPAYVTVNKMLASHGAIAGLVLFAGFVILHLALIIPMVMRTLEGAAKTVDFELPNSIWLQTAALLALPTFGGTIGLLGVGSVAACMAGVFLGLTLSMPLMIAFYSIDVAKATQAAILGGLFYLMTTAGSALALALIAWFVFPMWQMNVPWREPLPEKGAEQAANATPAPATNVETPKPAEVVATSPTTAESIFTDGGGSTAPPAAAPVEAPRPAVTWTGAADAPPQPLRWPTTDLHVMPEVTPPVQIVAAVWPSPFVALLDQDSSDVYDMRTGRRVGSIRERLSAYGAVLSPNGKYLLARRTAGGVGGNEPVVWSTADPKPMTRFAAAAQSGASRLLGFAGNERLVTGPRAGSSGTIQVWDAPSAQPLKSVDGEVGDAYAISPSGRYLATVSREGKLLAYDLENGLSVGEVPPPTDSAPHFRTVRAMAFSNDARAIAAVGGSAGAMHLIVWDAADGKLKRDDPLPASVGADLTPAQLRWLPDDQALLIGGDLIDRRSGRAYYKPASPVIAGASGAAVGVLSNYHILYAYAPAPAAHAAPNTIQRVIFKSAAMPKGEIDKALAVLRGSTWRPDEIAPALAASATPVFATAMASTNPVVATTGPAVAGGIVLADAAPPPAAARPMTLLERVKQKEWVVTVEVVRSVDTATLDQQIKAEQAKLPGIESRFNEARAYADKLEGETTTVRDRFGRYVQQRTRTNKEIGDARVIADRINEERRTAKQRIARWEREKKDAATTRTVVVKLDDGTTAQVDVDGAALAAIADTLTIGTKWKIAGGARIVDELLHIKPRAITPVE